LTRTVYNVHIFFIGPVLACQQENRIDVPLNVLF